MAKKSHEQYIRELELKNPKIMAIGKYTGCDTKIEFMCKECNNRWYAKPSSVLKLKYGCPKCAGNVKITHEEFVSRIEKINPLIEIIGEYISANKKVKCRCKTCDREWDTTPSTLYRGSGCISCKLRESKASIRKTHEQFVSEMMIKNDTIEIVGEYKNAQTHIDCQCKVCGHKWKATPNHLLGGRGCPVCKIDKIRAKNRCTQEDVYGRLKKAVPYITVNGEYIDRSTLAKCHCNICGNDWEVSFGSLLSGHGCYRCYGGMRIIESKFFEDMSRINSHISFPDGFNYKNYRIKCECADCGEIFYQFPRRLLNGSGCPNCKMPHGEKIVANILTDNSIQFTKQKTFDTLLGVGGHKLSYDFFLPDYDILIEIQGRQHEIPIEYFGGVEHFKTQQVHDERKRLYAEDHGYKLLYIWYYEYNKSQEKILSLINEARNDHSYASNRVAYAGISMRDDGMICSTEIT